MGPSRVQSGQRMFHVSLYNLIKWKEKMEMILKQCDMRSWLSSSSFQMLVMKYWTDILHIHSHLWTFVWFPLSPLSRTFSLSPNDNPNTLSISLSHSHTHTRYSRSTHVQKFTADFILTKGFSCEKNYDCFVFIHLLGWIWFLQSNIWMN